MNSKKKLPSPSVTESVATGGIGLWYTGCYINEEDACLLDMMKDNNQESSFETGTFPDSKAITIKNITVRLSSTQFVCHIFDHFRKLKGGGQMEQVKFWV